MQKINILWTGGWDSTFRVLMLRTKEIIIQPYYLKFGRPSEHIEIETVNKLTEAVHKLPGTKCLIQPLIVKSKENIGPDNPYYLAWAHLDTKSHLGDQYIQLAILSREINELEMAIHKDDKAHYFIRAFAGLKYMNDSCIGDYYEIDKKNTFNEDVLLLFENLRFPLLDWTKLEMKNVAKNQKTLKLMEMTWFCHTPIHNKPCGRCRPCVYTIQEGLKYRFNNKALIRYYLNNFYCFYKSKKISEKNVFKVFLKVTGLKALFFKSLYK